jgi:hypothetical protein
LIREIRSWGILILRSSHGMNFSELILHR